MKKAIITASFVFFLLKCFSQDPHFSQYNNARMYLNPAFAGCDSTLNLAMNYRVQWPNAVPYNTFFFSADKYVRCLHGGIGLNYMRDDAMRGALITSRLDFSYAGHIELRKGKLVIRPAVQISYFEKSLDWSQLTFGDQVDPRRGFVYSSSEIPGSSRKSNIDLSAGLLVHNPYWYAGFAAHHITEPDEGFVSISKLPVKLTVHGGANIEVGNKSSSGVLSPNIIYMRQADFYLLMPGITLKIKNVSFGVNYRSEDALIATLAFQNRFLRVGYSYDYTTSTLGNKNTGGSHEIGLTWFMNFRKSVCTRNTLRLI